MGEKAKGGPEVLGDKFQKSAPPPESGDSRDTGMDEEARKANILHKTFGISSLGANTANTCQQAAETPIIPCDTDPLPLWMPISTISIMVCWQTLRLSSSLL
jgi:hypothetical protein